MKYFIDVGLEGIKKSLYSIISVISNAASSNADDFVAVGHVIGFWHPGGGVASKLGVQQTAPQNQHLFYCFPFVERDKVLNRHDCFW